MTDPYSVLGVSASATDDEIRVAYRTLAKKYHPDAYKDNPLADLAEEKMKEINEAYDQITKERASGRNYAGGGRSYGSSGGSGRSGGSSYSGANASVYARVRSCLNMHNVEGAQALLDGIVNRDAEWYFLMGSVNYQKGWMEEAYTDFQTAAGMDPSNSEYQAALRRMNGRTSAYRTGGQNAGAGGMNPCNCCSSLLCADCLCECFGGDLVPCC